MNSLDQYKNNANGFTFIELLVVIAIIGIIAALATPFLSSFIQRTQFQSTKQQIQSSIAKAQSYAMQGKNSETWGVCLDGNVIVLYSGSCISPITSEQYSIPQTITLSGLSDIPFDSRGVTSNPSTITVSSDLQSAEIVINASGILTDTSQVTPTTSVAPTTTPVPTITGSATPTPTQTTAPTPTSPPTTPTFTPTHLGKL